MMNDLENLEDRALRLLHALYELAENDVGASPERLCRRLELPLRQVERLLSALDRQGLVDRERCRLTMKGLVLAVSMAGRGRLAALEAAA